ncbi:undecaprenyldiphospho-muramoylpentapeptide beta-N-acetylglucosaminyltransferase [Flaviaesturariibacter aridisoli]|uniref:UDP-N-acetylglucosamine--N-acetylmuramyl-(pentapeptide) pyrophosphoryl-undecaprenol N-acetylglucosamine transferase n=1 Tax=Flaviaesturariibacter aridisoli TaxID=2545761 RepID=A0A4R4DXR6_9BACT|nr:undecaprenyldiphospho-muramoylpentapeptide beta-N-acetylglucosaminyltransferase [Flaviaesturariibacter aridisoli]TCZ69916.1 undecaprenyldiphospho-muramoylpentapeptide beta-N-acetylglucosaminyltransferase [Flaviaesturariibacter aridisoli]
MSKRIIIAGGGTGGHIFPALAIANALKQLEPTVEILFVGARGKMEMEKVPQAGYPIKGLDIAGFNRSSLLKNIWLPFKLVKSFFQVRSIVRDFAPDAVIGVGGYSSFPVLRYAQAKGIPTFLHESNSFAGKSNMLLGKKATRVFVAATGMERFFPADKLEVVGNPIRPGIVKTAALPKSEALRFFGLQEGRVTVLAVGGSLGARSINEALASHLDALVSAGIQLIWQTGKTDAARWREAADGKPGIWVGDFITHMEQAYAAADIVVSRAGAMAVAELCVVAKPVLFVPYPHAAEDHQTANARHLVEQNAALMIADSEAKNKIVPELLALAGDGNQQELLRRHIGTLGVTDADQKIGQAILKQIA